MLSPSISVYYISTKKKSKGTLCNTLECDVPFKNMYTGDK